MENQMDQTYNGWSNYETWRVNLELFDGFLTGGQEIKPDTLKAYAEEVVLDGAEVNSHAAGYALAFIEEVNWGEIAQRLNKENSEAREYARRSGEPKRIDEIMSNLDILT